MIDRVFCRILAGELPASCLFRGESVTSLRAISRVNPGHPLVAPTAHAAALADRDPAASTPREALRGA